MKNKNVIYLLLVLSLQILVACSKNAQPEIVDTPLVVKKTEVAVTPTPIPTLTYIKPNAIAYAHFSRENRSGGRITKR